MKKILVVAAHPDDETLGCGGTLKKLSSKFDISVCFLTSGVESRNNNKKIIISNQKKLISDSKIATKILGCKNQIYLDLKDNELDKYSLLTIVKKIENLILTIKPQIIFTHFPNDLNIDHFITSKATVTASRPIKNNSFIKKIIFFETLSSSEWTIKERFNPNLYVDISKQIKYKIKAFKNYKSEIRKFPHPRSVKAIIALSNLRGSEVSITHAEAFQVFRSVE